MSLPDIPSYFADATGMNETTAQLILSLIVIASTLFPYLILVKGKPQPLMTLILLFLSVSVTTGLGWSPFWILIMFILFVASGSAVLGAKSVTGR